MASTPFGVRTSTVWLWDADTETYGTGVETQSLQAVSFDPQHDTDMLRVLGVVEETLSVFTHIAGSADFGGIDWASMSVMLGTDDSSSGANTHQNDDEGGDDLPYFGWAFAIPLKNGKEAHVYLPKVQLQKRVPLELTAENQFAIPSIDFMAMRLRLADGTTYPVRKYFEKASSTALADIDGVIGLA